MQIWNADLMFGGTAKDKPNKELPHAKNDREERIWVPDGIADKLHKLGTSG